MSNGVAAGMQQPPDDEEEQQQQQEDVLASPPQMRPGYSRKEKSLGLLCDNFLATYVQQPPGLTEICLDDVSARLEVERRRIYDIVNVLESVEIVTRRQKNSYMWNGLGNLAAALQRLAARTPQAATPSSSQSGATDMAGGDAAAAASLADISGGGGASGAAAAQQLLSDDASEVCGGPARYVRKDKSLGLLSQRFIQLFLASRSEVISLDDAARALLGGESGDNKLKTKVRRLYDIANVLSSLRLLEKTQLPAGRKPAFRWRGAPPPGEFGTGIAPSQPAPPASAFERLHARFIDGGATESSAGGSAGSQQASLQAGGKRDGATSAAMNGHSSSQSKRRALTGTKRAATNSRQLPSENTASPSPSATPTPGADQQLAAAAEGAAAAAEAHPDMAAATQQLTASAAAVSSQINPMLLGPPQNVPGVVPALFPPIAAHFPAGSLAALPGMAGISAVMPGFPSLQAGLPGMAGFPPFSMPSGVAGGMMQMPQLAAGMQLPQMQQMQQMHLAAMQQMQQAALVSGGGVSAPSQVALQQQMMASYMAFLQQWNTLQHQALQQPQPGLLPQHAQPQMLAFQQQQLQHLPQFQQQQQQQPALPTPFLHSQPHAVQLSQAQAMPVQLLPQQHLLPSLQHHPQSLPEPEQQHVPQQQQQINQQQGAAPAAAPLPPQPPPQNAASMPLRSGSEQSFSMIDAPFSLPPGDASQPFSSLLAAANSPQEYGMLDADAAAADAAGDQAAALPTSLPSMGIAAQIVGSGQHVASAAAAAPAESPGGSQMAGVIPAAAAAAASEAQPAYASAVPVPPPPQQQAQQYQEFAQGAYMQPPATQLGESGDGSGVAGMQHTGGHAGTVPLPDMHAFGQETPQVQQQNSMQ